MDESIAEECARIRRSGACATPVPPELCVSGQTVEELLRDQRALTITLHNVLHQQARALK